MTTVSKLTRCDDALMFNAPPAGNAPTPHDNLPAVGGKTVGTVQEKAFNAFCKLKVPNYSPNLGWVRRVELYAAELNRIGKAAADAAIKQWLES
jgi:hypothetical protein